MSRVLRTAIEELLPILGLADRVTITGWLDRDAMPELYQQADIFVFPSEGEGISNSILEAMSSGLPVVVYRVPGCVELVENEVNGFTIPPGDSAAFTQALQRLLENPALRMQMGQQSRQRTVENFSWARCSESYLELFASVIKK